MEFDEVSLTALDEIGSFEGCEEIPLVSRSVDQETGGIQLASLMDAVQQIPDLFLDVDSYASNLTSEKVTPEEKSVELLMALREAGLLIQGETVEVDRDKTIDVPIWVLVSLFRSILKRLR